MGFVKIIREIKTKYVSLLKIRMLMQIVSELLRPLCSNDSIFNVRNRANFYKDLYEVIKVKSWHYEYLITDWWQYAKFRHGGIFHFDLSEYYNKTSDFTKNLFVTSSLRFSIAGSTASTCELAEHN